MASRRQPGSRRRFLFWRSRRPDPILEEADWRHRMILASRKIQQVYQTLSADLVDVRVLREHLKVATPAIEQLERELAASGGIAGSLQRKLDEHSVLLQALLERTPGAQASPEAAADRTAHEARLHDLERELDQVRAELEAGRSRRAEDGEGGTPERPVDAPRSSEQTVGGSDARARELEEQLIRIEEKRALEAAHRAEEMEGLKRVSSARIAELESQVAMLEAAARTQGTERDRESDQELERARERIAELELQLGIVESARADLGRACEEGLRIQEASAQQISQLEAVLQSVEDDRVRQAQRAAEELREARAQSEARIAELEKQAARAEAVSRKAEEELAGVARGGDPQARELEEKLERLESLENGEQEHRGELKELRERFENRISELEDELRRMEAAREDLRRDSARELAESAARIMELEAFNAELEEARSEVDEQQTGGRKEIDEALGELREAEELRIELEKQHVAELEEVSTTYEARLQELEQEVETLRRTRTQAEAAPDGTSELRAQKALVADLRKELHDAELSRLELETRHTQEMTDLADHSWVCMQNLEAVVREKEEALRSMSERCRDLESTLDRMRTVLNDKEREAALIKEELDEARRIQRRRAEADEPTLVRLDDESELGQDRDEPTVVHLPEEDEAERKRRAEIDSKVGKMLGGWRGGDESRAG